MRRTRTRCLGVALAAALLLAGCARPQERPRALAPHAFRFPRGAFIAHALGAIDGHAYTNSLEAFDASLAAGARYFEVDLSFTADGDLVCYHPADVCRKRTGLPAPIAEVSTAEFLRHRCDGRYTLMTFRTLLERVAAHPGVFLVTDTKTPLAPSLAAVVREAERVDHGLIRRIIPQIYQPDQWRAVADLERAHGPFATVIFTLYRTRLDDDGVVDVVRRRRIPVVTMSRRRFDPDLVRRLRALGVDVMVHTVNDPAAIAGYLARGVRGIYTDVAFRRGRPAREAGAAPSAASR